jgi:hypothetical protein
MFKLKEIICHPSPPPLLPISVSSTVPSTVSVYYAIFVAVAVVITVNIPLPFAVALALSSSLSLLPYPLLSPTQSLLPLPSPLLPPYQSQYFCHHCMLLLLVNVP